MMKKQYKTLILVQLVIAFLIIISFIFLKSSYINLLPKCIFKEKFGIICPACYGTTFAIEMAKFNFIEALKVHPVFFILLMYLVLLNTSYIINVIFKKTINIFRWWHTIIWLIFLLIYTIVRNI